MSESRFTVAIVGGGIGGLALALAISKGAGDIAVDIYESAPSFSDNGAGLVLWPRILEILVQWGFEDDLKDRSAPAEHAGDKKMNYYKGDQAKPLKWGKSLYDLNGLHRAEFLKMFVSRVASTRCKTHFEKKFDSYEILKNGQVILRFVDGSETKCDCLIGADGVRSSVRRAMYTKFENLAQAEGRPVEEVEKLKSCIAPKWSGELLYRSLVSRADLQKSNPNHISLRTQLYYTGKSKFLMSYPVSQGVLLNTGAVICQHEYAGTEYQGSWSATVTKDELHEHFSGWTEEAHSLINNMKDIYRWAVNYTEPLPTYIDQKVALLGDSAHAMVTHQASGAGQTIEDAYVLGALLAHPRTNKGNLHLVLEVYDVLRRPKARDIQEKSIKTGKMIMMETLEDVSAEESAKGLVPLERLERLQEDIQSQYRWTQTSAEGDRAEAVRVFEERLEPTERTT